MGALTQFLTVSEEQAYIGSFIAGIFFTSVFTLAPATVALVELSNNAMPFTIALWGALGAMLGDLLLFLFIRDVFSNDLESVFHISKLKRLVMRPHRGFLRWLLPVVGAFIIASPLPDELGLAIMGASRTRTIIILPICFIMNFFGILAIAVIAAHVL